MKLSQGIQRSLMMHHASILEESCKGSLVKKTICCLIERRRTSHSAHAGRYSHYDTLFCSTVTLRHSLSLCLVGFLDREVTTVLAHSAAVCTCINGMAVHAHLGLAIAPPEECMPPEL